jgi:sporulation protein YlmC with PRC-barrel domain
MIISDLNHLEVVSEASSVVGGLDIDLDIDQDQNKKLDIKKGNVSLINQVGTATAVAISFKGKAVAKAKVENQIT